MSKRKATMTPLPGVMDAFPNPRLDDLAAQTGDDDVIVKITHRIPAPLAREMKVFAAQTGQNIQDVLTSAIRRYLDTAR